MNNSDQLTGILTTVLLIMIAVLAVFLVIYVVLRFRIKKAEKDREKRQQQEEAPMEIEPEVNGKKKVASDYTRQSIYSFMKFDKIEDNMIIREKGKKFVMAVECQGINYDLMAEVEKVGVEQGFLQFLNTLRYPIQLYVQTRTVNLGRSIATYKDRLKTIENRLVSKQMDYNQKANSGNYSEKDLANERMEVIRERNLYEYGRDIINNTERMSQNKNILQKHYYVIVSYMPEEASNPKFSDDELRDIAFNELYTRCRSMINSLMVCGVKGKVLNSNELAELLYVAYNREDSEVYGMERALNARYDELYSTSQDVLDRKLKALDQKVEEEAVKRANEALLDVAEETEKERAVREKEENMNDLISKMAKIMIEENSDFVGPDMAEKAKEKIDKDDEKRGGKKDGKQEKAKTATRRKRTTA